jgi:signal transduction histidine kinase
VFPELDGEMDAIRQAISERKIHRDRKSSTAIGGEARFTDLTVYPLVGEEVAGAVIRIDDITDLVRLEEMVVQSEKMLSVGGLAAGMAHEINNPLAGMVQSAQVVLNRVTGDLASSRRAAAECGVSLESVKGFMEKRNIVKLLTNICTSGRRAADIVHNMLSFSRREDASRLAPHDLAGLLDKTVNLASNDYDLKKKYDFRRIEIIRRYDPELPAAPCEETKIQQVVLNLLKNAAQAMAQGGPRAEPARITLRTMREGDMARIEVEDNGPGMDEQTRKRVFEPFFTTKAVGMGAGLGLSVSYFIITEHHQGRMEAESAPGGGAKFIILLPLSAGRRPDQPAPAGLAPRPTR